MLRRTRYLLMLLLVATLAHGQGLRLYEYWLDSDYSRHTTVRSSETDIEFDIDIAQEQTGVHYLNFRAQNDAGEWGTISRFLCFLPEPANPEAKVTRYQYWIDNDYAGNKTQPTDGGDIAMAFDINVLAAGVHYLNFRAQNSDGVWGNLSRYLFFVPEPTSDKATVSEYEYWFDNDHAGRHLAKASAGGDFFANIDISQMAAGVHYLNFRARNSEGVWSNLSRYLVYIPDGGQQTGSPITGYRYGFNDRYTYVPLNERTDYELNDLVVEIPSLMETGSLVDGCTYTFDDVARQVRLSRHSHVSFAIQFQNKTGNWSAPAATEIEMDDSLEHPILDWQPQRSLTTGKVAHGDFLALRMQLAESRDYFLRATQPCQMLLYEQDGRLLTTIDAQALLNTCQISLTQGTYYVIIYNTLKDADHPDDQLTLKLMLNSSAVPAPVISYENETVSITCGQEGAAIYYTLDGTDPSEARTRYTAPFPLKHYAVIKAMAVFEGDYSEITVFRPEGFTCEKPVFSYDGRHLQMQTATEGATIHYTLDGSLPSNASPVYNGTIDISAIVTVRAIAMMEHINNSEVASMVIPCYYDGTKAEVGTAGTLSQAFGWCDASAVSSLTLAGSLNDADMAWLRTMQALQHLDMAEAHIDGDRLPDGAFSGMPLVNASLPASLTAVGSALFSQCPQLAAIIWNARLKLTEQALQGVGNPNLLLYVDLATDAPASVRNTVVSGMAASIVLTDGDGNTNFFCPRPFTAAHISYTHRYTMLTEPGVCRGWETIALPFDVQQVTHPTRGAAAPFAAGSNDAKPFWLARLQAGGFADADRIDANTPYIISMPNNPSYADAFLLAGDVTFEARQAQVHATSELIVDTKGEYSFVPCFVAVAKTDDVLPINRGQEFDGFREGSNFFRSLPRNVRPFEAYIWSPDGHESRFAIGQQTSSVSLLPTAGDSPSACYDLQGRKVGGHLQKGIYIRNRQKVVMK